MKGTYLNKTIRHNSDNQYVPPITSANNASTRGRGIESSQVNNENLTSRLKNNISPAQCHVICNLPHSRETKTVSEVPGQLVLHRLQPGSAYKTDIRTQKEYNRDIFPIRKHESYKTLEISRNGNRYL